MMRAIRSVIATVTLALAGGLSAQPLAPADPPAARTSSAEALAEATVRRVDPGTGKITLRHGFIPGLEMPPMTMVFRVRDPSWLERLQPGDQIRFDAARVDGAYTVTRLELPEEPAPSRDPAAGAASASPAPASPPAAAAAPAGVDTGLADYRGLRTDEPLVNWRQANAEVGRLRGHPGHLVTEPGTDPPDHHHHGH